MTHEHTKKHIVLTGGHVTPAYAVIQELQKRGYQNISFIGRRYTDRQRHDVSFEYDEIARLTIPYYDLQTGRLSRKIQPLMLVDFWHAAAGLGRAYALVNKLKPDLIVSFGGYIAFPVAVAARLKGIPIITHEQTIAPGIANTMIGHIADKILISFTETAAVFDKKKTVFTGNPLRKELKTEGEALFKKIDKKPVLFVTGGSLGAHAINMLIEDILPQLTEIFTVIHQIGNISEYSDFERLFTHAAQDYWPYKSLTATQMAWAYRQADLVISRSGANTLAELIAFKKPAILIPLPWSGAGEQQKHAEFFAAHGLGEVFSQFDPAEKLHARIKTMWHSIESYKKNHATFSSHDNFDAAAHIADIIESCVR